MVRNELHHKGLGQIPRLRWLGAAQTTSVAPTPMNRRDNGRRHGTCNSIPSSSLHRRVVLGLVQGLLSRDYSPSAVLGTGELPARATEPIPRRFVDSPGSTASQGKAWPATMDSTGKQQAANDETAGPRNSLHRTTDCHSQQVKARDPPQS